MNKVSREGLASLSHDIWAHWMQYIFKNCEAVTDGSILIPVDKVKKWTRQMTTPYESLSEVEKDSDREQANKIITFLERGRL